MSSSISTKEPLVIIQGQSATWVKTIEDYPADEGYVLTYTFVSPTGKITITAEDDGTGKHLVTLSTATTAAYTAGRYHGQGIVAKDDEAHVEFEGVLQIKAGFASAGDTGLDARSHDEKMLDALETALESKASLTPDQLSLSVGGVNIARMTWRQLLEARDEYKARVEGGASEDDRDRGGGVRRYRGLL